MIDILDTPIRTETTRDWDPHLLQSLIDILQPNRKLDEGKVDPYVEKLQTHLKQVDKEPLRDMVFNRNKSKQANRALASEGQDPDQLVNLLNDIGPACTRTAQTFRDTLTDLSGTYPINEAALARIIHFLSSKAGEPPATTASTSSALLGSLPVSYTHLRAHET